jgi:hypothetical protein
MAIRKAVQPKHGFFVTFTFNCGCPEMEQMIGRNANPADSPDLCCRLATLKFRQLLQQVTGPNGIFGAVKAFIWSREYQQRGNKHWHLVLMCDPAEAIDTNTAEFIDQYITAKIPEDPTLDDPDYEAKKYYYDLVTKLYIHDCDDNEEAACRRGRPNGECRFGFPARYSSRTVIHPRQRVLYARPSPDHGGRSFPKRLGGGRSKTIDNRFVVPHNRTLTMLMGSHVNVEFVSEFDFAFYLFK